MASPVCENEAITISDTGSVAANTLTTIATANSSGTLNVSGAATITGTAEQIINAYADSTITEASDVALTVDSEFWNSVSNSGEKS